ncbi:MAG TPA: protealysin inhibitor emfourin [Jatrophihabitans sp.]|nr:protealysin inhibitor emfourin [Jatrophihabitans sp.]
MSDQGFRLHYRRSGGFAGVQLAVDVLAGELPAEQAEQAARMLAHPEEFRAAGSPAAPPGSADLFSYQLELERGEERQDFRWTEFEVPDAARPLLTALRGLAKPAPPR